MASITFSLKFQARALAPLHAEKLYSKWIVGTNSLREENEVRGGDALRAPGRRSG